MSLRLINYTEHYSSMSHNDLVNRMLNRMVGNIADFSEKEEDPHGHGKRIPYIGWFWRSVDFINKSASIGWCGEFVGIMENNKWDYKERYLDKEEFEVFEKYLWEALSWRNSGGDVKNNYKMSDKIFTEMWDWFQGLRV